MRLYQEKTHHGVELSLTPDQFKAIVKSKGWTYRELAEWWRVSPVWVSNIARNKNRARHFDDAVMGLPNKVVLLASLKRRQSTADNAVSKIQKGKTHHPFKQEDYLFAGAVVVAMEDIGSIAEAGTKGILFDIRIKNRTPEYGVMFQNGKHEWLPKSLMDAWVSETGLSVPQFLNYKFVDEAKLAIDFNSGMLDI